MITWLNFFYSRTGYKQKKGISSFARKPNFHEWSSKIYRNISCDGCNKQKKDKMQYTHVCVISNIAISLSMAFTKSTPNRDLLILLQYLRSCGKKNSLRSNFARKCSNRITGHRFATLFAVGMNKNKNLRSHLRSDTIPYNIAAGIRFLSLISFTKNAGKIHMWKP